MADEASKTISVRPSKTFSPQLERVAAQLGKSPGEVLMESAMAVVEMIETGKNFVPTMVKVARALRESGVTFADQPDEIIDDVVVKKARPAASMGLTLAGAM